MPADIEREIATLAGGCFWCLEAVYQELSGVSSVESGYIGGHVENPSYEQVCSGRTGHAEAVRISFDPARLSYRDVLEVFFAIHDPATLNRQGNDVGTQYRSAIFYHDDTQRDTALKMKAELEREGALGAPIVTEIAPAGPFYPAGDYHRDYFRSHPSQPYCGYVISPKLAKFRKRFASSLARV